MSRAPARPGPAWRAAIALAAGGIAAACAPAGQPPGRAALSGELARISAAFVEEHRVPGLAVGVIADGQVVYEAGFGTTRLGGGEPVTAGTIFHLASVTKPFVGTAVMQLVQAGAVELDQPVTRYLPDFRMRDPRAAGITVRQVLTHTAGLPDVTDYAWDRPEYDAAALARWIATLADSALIAAPGERWAYSNIGFELLAHLVATVAGRPFEDQVRERILAPLGMAQSTLLMTDVDSTRLAWGHEADSTGAHAPAGYPYNRRHAGSSTLHSNVTDMLRWARANLARGELDGVRILEPAAYDALWREERDITAGLLERARRAGVDLPYDRMAMGLSWFLPARDGVRMVSHSGGDRGFRSDLVLAPSRRAAVVVMTNGSAGVTALSAALLRAVLAAPPAPE